MKSFEKLGGNRTVNVLNAAIGAPHAVLSWRACDDDDIRVIRVALFTERKQPPAGDVWFVKTRARVEFGAGQLLTHVFVDWKNGTQLSLPARAVDVSAIVIARGGSLAPGEFADATAFDFDFGAMITHGGDIRNGINTLTMPLITIPGGGGTATVVIPPFAYALTIASVDATFFVATTGIFQLGAALGGTNLNTTDGAEFETNGFRSQGWLIAEGARVIGFNNTAAGAITAEPMFLIAV